MGCATSRGAKSRGATLRLPGLMLFTLISLCLSMRGQNAPSGPAQQLVFAGLRSVAAQGQINSVATDAAGNIYLLLDQGDGVRMLKVDSVGGALLAQAQLGAKDDVGIAMALDPLGNIYVAGTTSSSTLVATPGAAFAARNDTLQSSFVAKYDAGLHPLFVTFTGASRIAATGVAATADGVFLTGVLRSSSLPVTAGAVQRMPARETVQNGFVEKFSPSGSALLYATYLTGAMGDTTPTAIQVDAAGDAYIAGSTTASGFPTVAALVPSLLSSPSGFLTRLAPAGDRFDFSTFIPGAGLTSVALDRTGRTLIVSGGIALGQFPVTNVSMPLVPTTYQVLLRMPLDGSDVLSSTLIAPGQQSFVTAGANESAWVDGVLTAPLFASLPLADVGTGFLARVTAQNQVDLMVRLGGVPTTNTSFASLPALLTSIATDPSGAPLVAGAVQPTASSTLLGSETYDLLLRNAPTEALPSGVHDAELSAASCSGSLCAGSAAYLAKIALNASAPALAFSTDDAPLVTLRNLGSASAEGLVLRASDPAMSTNCGLTLAPGGTCSLLLSGNVADTVTASAGNSALQTANVRSSSSTGQRNTIAFTPRELDFGVQSATSPAGARMLTISNLGTVPQSFSSALNSSAQSGAYFSELSSDCPLSGSPQVKTLPPGGVCDVTIGFAAKDTPSSDGFIQGEWVIGGRSVILSGYSQAAALGVSASEVDFGTQLLGGLRLPRYLYLSNSSTSATSHAPLTLSSQSPFSLADECPTMLQAGTVCRIRIDYLSAVSPSNDAVTLQLDGGISVLVTGETLPLLGTSNGVNPALSVTPGLVKFADATVVTGVSNTTETIGITNTGMSAFSLSQAISGDFTEVSSCGATLGAGESCAVAVSFVPTHPGLRQGFLTVSAGAGTDAIYIPLSGVGVSILQTSSQILDLGAVAVGQPQVQFFKVAQPFNSLAAVATSPYSVALIEDTGFGHGQPSASAYRATAVGSCHNCYLAVQFRPGETGIQPGRLTLSTSASGSSFVLDLTGFGLPLSGLLLAPAIKDFDPVPLHSLGGATLFTLTNLNTDGAPVSLSGPLVSGDFLLDQTQGDANTCIGALAYTASCTFGITFAPSATGLRSGSVSIPAGDASASALLTGLGTSDPGLALRPSSLTFHNIQGGSGSEQTVTVLNTGPGLVQVGTPTTSSSNFTLASTCGSLQPGGTCSISVSFYPSAAPVLDEISIPVTRVNSANVIQTEHYAVSLSGAFTSANAAIEIFPHVMYFGAEATGSQGISRQYSVSNLSSRRLTLQIDLPRDFVLTSAPCLHLPVNASCSFSVSFLPLTNGDLSGSLVVQATADDGSATIGDPISEISYVEGFGVGQGALTLSGGLIVDRTFNFGQVTSGQSLSQLFTFSNNNAAGSAPITIRRVSSAPPFLSTTTCGASLASMQSCSITVTYAPVSQAPPNTSPQPSTRDAGVLIVESDATSSVDNLYLSGEAASVSVLNPSNVTPLATFSLSQGSLTFTSVLVGNSSASQMVTLTNTGTATLHVNSTSAPADFQVQSGCLIVVPGAACNLEVTSAPRTSGQHIGALQIYSDSATSLEFISLLSASDVSVLSFSPEELDFGSILVGEVSRLPIRVTNTGGTPVVFTSITPSADYEVIGSCPSSGGSLLPGATCIVQVLFRPSRSGSHPGKLLFASSASATPLTLFLSGSANQAILLTSPTSLDFGDVVLGNFRNLSFTLTNTGSAPTSNLVFALSAGYLVSIPCPLATLAPGSSCAVQVSFIPTAAASLAGSLLITSSDLAVTTALPLFGMGVEAGSFTLTVDGGASSTVSVRTGEPASFRLKATSSAGFSGSVALTCKAITAGQFASCSLLPATLVLSGDPQNATVTINTISSAGGNALLSLSSARILTCVLLPGILVLSGKKHKWPKRMAAILLLLAIFPTSGCGSRNDFGTRYTPAGTYQYVVTASSTNGVALSQTVTLNVSVTEP